MKTETTPTRNRLLLPVFLIKATVGEGSLYFAVRLLKSQVAPRERAS